MSVVSRTFIQENRNVEQNFSAIANFLSSNGFEVTKTEVVGSYRYMYLTDVVTGCNMYFRQYNLATNQSANSIIFAAISEEERREVDEISFSVAVAPTSTTTLPFTFKITLRRGVGTFAIQIAPYNDLDSVNAGNTMTFWQLSGDRILYGIASVQLFYDYDASTDIATSRGLYNILDTSTGTQMPFQRVAMNPMYLVSADVIIEEEIPECYGIKHDGSLTSRNVLYKVNNVTYRLIRDNVLYKWE